MADKDNGKGASIIGGGVYFMVARLGLRQDSTLDFTIKIQTGKFFESLDDAQRYCSGENTKSLLGVNHNPLIPVKMEQANGGAMIAFVVAGMELKFRQMQKGL